MSQTKLDILKNNIQTMNKVIVAFSGGVDSTLLAKIAYDVLGKNMLAITAVSDSIPQSEIDECKMLARELGFPHIFLESYEMEDDKYTENSFLRCYFCKKQSFGIFSEYAKEHGYHFVLDGNNADDIGDYRPGSEASKELGVLSPLQEIGLTKSEIRLIAKQLGLSIWDKPAAACLSSRIPYGSEVTANKLKQIDDAELYIKEFNIQQLRVRHHESIARIEVLQKDFPIILNHYSKIVSYLKNLGFVFVTLDLGGFNSGNMNKLIDIEGK